MLLRRMKVEYIDGRRFFHETTSRDVASRDVGAALQECPKGHYGFRFYDIEYQIAKRDDGSEVEVDHKQVNRSGTYFINGTVYDEAGVKEHVSDNSILLSNMEGNGWSRVVRTKTGNICPFLDKDEIVSVS